MLLKIIVGIIGLLIIGWALICLITLAIEWVIDGVEDCEKDFDNLINKKR